MPSLEHADWDSTEGRKRIYFKFAREELVPNDKVFHDFELFILVAGGLNYAFLYNQGSMLKFCVFEKNGTKPIKTGEIRDEGVIKRVMEQKKHLGKNIGGIIDNATEIFFYLKEKDTFQSLSLLDKETYAVIDELIEIAN